MGAVRALRVNCRLAMFVKDSFRQPHGSIRCTGDLNGCKIEVHCLTNSRGVRVTQLKRIAFIGNSLPRRCGIATFTTDLQRSIAAAALEVETAIVAMTDYGKAYDYPSVVRLQVKQD